MGGRDSPLGPSFFTLVDCCGGQYSLPFVIDLGGIRNSLLGDFGPEKLPNVIACPGIAALGDLGPRIPDLSCLWGLMNLSCGGQGIPP